MHGENMKLTKTIFDSVNHTRFPKEDHLPDWARRNNQVKKGDRVDAQRVHLYTQITSKLLPIINNNNFTWQASGHAVLRMKSSLFISIAGEVTQSKYQMPSRSSCENLNGLHIGALVLPQSEISPPGNYEKQLHRTPVY